MCVPDTPISVDPTLGNLLLSDDFCCGYRTATLDIFLFAHTSNAKPPFIDLRVSTSCRSRDVGEGEEGEVLSITVYLSNLGAK